MKPVGQRTVIEDGQPADEDAVLMQAVFGLPESFPVMSPVHIPRGFTKAYIAGNVVEDLGARIREAHRTFADHDMLLIEGTGHAGVGAVIGLSNAVVAADAGSARGHRLARAGSAGRSTRSCSTPRTSRPRRDRRGRDRQQGPTSTHSPGSSETLERGLARYGIPLLGVLPYRPILSNPTLGMVLEGVRGE